MSAELRIPSPAAVLVPLADRLPPLVTQGPHGDGGALREWARRYGLPVGAGYHELAAALLPSGGELYARWLAWAFAFDDWCDEGTGSREPAMVGALLGRLRETMKTGHGTSEPLVAAFADLWRATAPGMSPAWGRRFAARLTTQAEAVRTQACNRRARRMPTAGEYPALRRDAFCGITTDLIEACLGVEVPGALHQTPPWQTLVAASIDVIAWCNDIVSLPKEQGDPHNYVLVAAARIGVPEPADWVVDRILERVDDLGDATAALGECGGSPEVAPVVACLLGYPRAYLEWLLESGRYRTT